MKTLRASKQKVYSFPSRSNDVRYAAGEKGISTFSCVGSFGHARLAVAMQVGKNILGSMRDTRELLGFHNATS